MLFRRVTETKNSDIAFFCAAFQFLIFFAYILYDPSVEFFAKKIKA